MSTLSPFITPTQEYVVPRSMPMMGSPGSTVVLVLVLVPVALAAGIAARGQIRMRKKRRMPTPKGSCRLFWRALLAMMSLMKV